VTGFVEGGREFTGQLVGDRLVIFDETGERGSIFVGTLPEREADRVFSPVSDAVVEPATDSVQDLASDLESAEGNSER
jgi:hypothetical protein